MSHDDHMTFKFLLQDMFMRTAEVNENYFLCQVALEKQIVNKSI